MRKYNITKYYELHSGLTRYRSIIILSENDDNVGYVRYMDDTGQVGLIYLEYKYRGLGIGKYLLTEVEMNLKINNINTVWVSCTKDHYFWSKQSGYTYLDNIHESVNSSGYLKHI